MSEADFLKYAGGDKTDTKVKMVPALDLILEILKKVKDVQVNDENFKFQGFDLMAVLEKINKVFSTSKNADMTAVAFVVLVKTYVLYTPSLTPNKMERMPATGRTMLKKALEEFGVKLDTRARELKGDDLTLSRIVAAVPSLALSYRNAPSCRPMAGVTLSLKAADTKMINFDQPIFCSTEGIYLCKSQSDPLYIVWLAWALMYHKKVNRNNDNKFNEGILLTKMESAAISTTAKGTYRVNFLSAQKVTEDIIASLAATIKRDVMTEVEFYTANGVKEVIARARE